MKTMSIPVESTDESWNRESGGAESNEGTGEAGAGTGQNPKLHLTSSI